MEKNGVFHNKLVIKDPGPTKPKIVDKVSTTKNAN